LLLLPSLPYAPPIPLPWTHHPEIQPGNLEVRCISFGFDITQRVQHRSDRITNILHYILQNETTS